MKLARLEIASLLRNHYKQFPIGMSYPEIITSSSFQKHKEKPLLSYSIIAGDLSQAKIHQLLNSIDQLQRETSGIKKIEISGLNSYKLSIKIDREKCLLLNIPLSLIETTIQNHLSNSVLGTTRGYGGDHLIINQSEEINSINKLKEFVLVTSNGTNIPLKKVSKISIESNSPSSVNRINGLDVISINIFAKQGQNKILLESQIQTFITEKLGEFQSYLNYDDTDLIKKTIKKNVLRLVITFLTLSVFWLFFFKSAKYVLLLFLTVFMNLSLICILLWITKVNIHSFTIAGLSLSIGFTIDYVALIIFYAKKYNAGIFKTIIISSLVIITICVLLIINVADGNNEFIDCIRVIILSTISSVIVSLIFLPALIKILRLQNLISATPSKKTNKIKLYISRSYSEIIKWLIKFKFAFYTVIILLFGLPTFLLPDHVISDKWYSSYYNKTIGSDYYNDNLRWNVDKWFGGFSRLFVKNLYINGVFQTKTDQELHIKFRLPNENSVSKTNFVAKKLESFLSNNLYIEKFISKINTGEEGNITISIKKAYLNTQYPRKLQMDLISFSSTFGGVQWDISGFSDRYNTMKANELPLFRLILKGYNYDTLSNKANQLAKLLKGNKYVDRLNSDEQIDSHETMHESFSLEPNNYFFAIEDLKKLDLIESLNMLRQNTISAPYLKIAGKNYPVFIEDKQQDTLTIYKLLHNNISVNAKIHRLLNNTVITNLTQRHDIKKTNRQYVRILSFDYLGKKELGQKFVLQTLDLTKKNLPPGFTAELPLNMTITESNQFSLFVAITLISIFVYSSILFQNFVSSFKIILLIPTSFIGILIGFGYGSFTFDEGGFASFLLVGGIVTNLCLFVLYDINSALKGVKSLYLYNELIINALQYRSKTIILTLISACCGFLPFIVEGQEEQYWFSFAIGSIFGLLFCFITFFFILPVLLSKKIK